MCRYRLAEAGRGDNGIINHHRLGLDWSGVDKFSILQGDKVRQTGKFFALFALQGIMVLVLWGALQTNNNLFVTFAAGAAFMTFVLMLLVWILSVVSSNNQ